MIVLIQPESREQGKLIYPPLGLMAVAARPHQAGIPVRILDGNVMDRAELVAELQRLRPRLVGITSFTGPMLKNALELSAIAKKTGAIVVWGGVHASILPEQVLAEPSIDVVVLFEGDEALVDLYEHLDDLSKVRGIAFRQDGQVVRTEPRPLIPDLAVLPAFPWHLVDGERYVIPWAQAARTLPIISSRGCPYRCTFCYNLVFNEQKWRPFPVERVKAEIDELQGRFRLDGVRLDASDLFIGPKREHRALAMEIVEHCHRRGLKWAAQVRTNQIDQQTLETFAKLGCNYLFFGIESGSRRVLKEIYKDVRVEEIRRVLDRTNQLGIKSAAGVMYDFPGETLDDFRETVHLFQQASVLVRFSALQPYPGTPVFDQVQREGLMELPTTTMGWTTFQYDQPHGLSKIPDVAARARLWNLKYNYGHNLLVTLKRRDWHFLRTMGGSFADYAAQRGRGFFGGKSFELNY